MTVIPFGEYLPDLPAIRNTGLVTALNAVPDGLAYKQFLGPRVLTDALGARCRGHFVHEDPTGVFYNYAGDATELYMASGVTWADAGSAGGYNLTSEDNWEAVHWDDKIVFTNITDEPEQDTIGTGTFATFMTSTNKPKAHHIAIINSQLVLGDVNEGGTIGRNRVVWSALGDHTDFDASLATLAGAQDLRGETSQVNKIFGGGLFGTIFQKESIWRMTFEGPPTIFRFDQITENIGMIGKRCGAKYGDNIFFLADGGFYLMSAATGELKPVGQNRVDNTILAELDKTALHRCSTVADPDTGIFYFSYPTSGGNADKIAAYNPFLDRWANIELEHQLLTVYVSGGAAGNIDAAPLSTRDIDADPYNIDSAEFKGGVSTLSVFNTANRLSTLDGTAQDATFQTGDVAFEEGRRSYVNKARPIVEGSAATTTVAVGTRELLTGTLSFGSATSLNSEGEATVRSSGRYMAFRTAITGGFDDAIGIEVEPKTKGRK